QRAEAEEVEVVREQAEVWDVLTKALDEWRQVAAGEEHPAYLRQRYLHMHGVGQQAIAVAVAKLRQECGASWASAATRLGEIDWTLVNAEWQGVALHG